LSESYNPVSTTYLKKCCTCTTRLPVTWSSQNCFFHLCISVLVTM
jgi:hypothetical protein